MKKIFATTMLAGALMTTPALAQSNNAANTNESNRANTQQQTGAATQSSNSKPAGMSRDEMVASQTRVQDVLTKAGLQDVKIMDAAYLVEARTPQNETVMMIVNSDGMPVTGNAANASAGQKNTTAN